MSDRKNVRSIEILLVDNSPGDADLIMESFADSKVLNNFHVVEDGAVAISFPKRLGSYASTPRPDAILLDLSLPKKNGLEVMAEINSDPQLKTIPVVIMTDSPVNEEILKSDSLPACCYLTKPVDFNQFAKAVRSIDGFWLAVVTLAQPELNNL